MSKSRNHVELIGNLGKDPEIKFTSSGKAIANFTIATNERYKDGEEWKDKTEWHSLVAWERHAEILRDYVKKGDKIFIEGKLQTRSWDDKTTGQKKYMTEIVTKDLILLGGNGGKPAPEAKEKSPDSDFPF